MTRAQAARHHLGIRRALDARAKAMAGSFLASTVRELFLTLAPDHAAELEHGAVADAPQFGLGESRQERGGR